MKPGVADSQASALEAREEQPGSAVMVVSSEKAVDVAPDPRVPVADSSSLSLAELRFSSMQVPMLRSVES